MDGFPACIETWRVASKAAGRFIIRGCARWNVSCATTPASPGWLHLLMPCVYLSQTRPKDTSGWYGGRMGGEAKGKGVWSSG